MSIRTVDPTALTVTMDDKDNKIDLTKNKDNPLMGKIHIKTVDLNIINDNNPQRYYIYKQRLLHR